MKKAKIETAENVNGETVVVYAPFTCTNCGKATHDLVSTYLRNGVNVVPAGHNWCGDCLRQMFPKHKLVSMRKATEKLLAKQIAEKELETEFKQAVGSDIVAPVTNLAKSGDKKVSEKLTKRIAERDSDTTPAKVKKAGKSAAINPQTKTVPAELDAILQAASTPKTAFVGIEEKPAPEPKAKKQRKPRPKVEKNETLKFTVSSDDTIVYEMNGLTTDRTTWRAAATRYQQRLLRRAEKAIRQRAAERNAAASAPKAIAAAKTPKKGAK